MYTLDLRSDGTFTFAAKETTPTSLGDVLNSLGFALIAPSGRWQLDEWELNVSCITPPQEVPVTVLLKVVRWSDDALVLRFGDGDAVRFVRK